MGDSTEGGSQVDRTTADGGEGVENGEGEMACGAWGVWDTGMNAWWETTGDSIHCTHTAHGQGKSPSFHQPNLKCDRQI